ncbi:MAG: iron ABC transporter permease [Firmicutes bacterium]|nr:iron ABC transporter permease [Bacillota bacterium]
MLVAIAKPRERKPGVGASGWWQLRQDPILLVTLIIISVSLFLFIVYPLYKVILLSVKPRDVFTLDVYKYIFGQWWLRQSFYNSLLLGTLTATASTIVGFLFAFALNRTDMPGKPFFEQMVQLPLVSPPFMFTLSVILLLGKNGLITKGLLGLTNFNIYGLKGLVLVQTISMFPIAYMTLNGVMQGISPDLEEGALDLGASRFAVFRSITLPLSVPGLASAWLLVFVTSLADFANPMVLGGTFEVLSVQAYLQFTGMFNAPRGTALAVMLLIPAMIAFLVQRYWVSKKSYVTVTGKPTSRRILEVSPWVRWSLFIFCSLISLVIISFYGTVIMGAFVDTWGVNFNFTLKHWRYAWDVGYNSIKSTVFLALIATPITGILGMVIAYILVRKEFPGKRLLGLISMLAFAVPGTVVGIGYILAFNEPPLLLSGTAAIIVLTFVFREVPVGIESGVASLIQIDKSIEEASTNLGASTGYTFSHITLPLIKPAFLAGLFFAFTRSMTAVSAIIFLVSARWHHLTVLILSQTEIMRLGAASVLSLILIIIVLIAFAIMRLVVGDTANRQLPS